MQGQMMTEKLMQFGLTRQEALLYLTLVREETLTGYEAAKLTGISRSNAYSALAGLVEKGAAYVMESTAVKYIPVKAGEFCSNKIRQMKEAQAYLEAHMPVAREVAEGYITIEGYQHILDKMRNMLKETEHRVYLSITGKQLHYIREELEALITEGKKVVLLTDQEIDLDGGVIHRTEERDGQVRLIIDSDRILTGEFGCGDEICLYSGQKNFVDVLKDALRNEIKLREYEKADREEA